MEWEDGCFARKGFHWKGYAESEIRKPKVRRFRIFMHTNTPRPIYKERRSHRFHGSHSRIKGERFKDVQGDMVPEE